MLRSIRYIVLALTCVSHVSTSPIAAERLDDDSQPTELSKRQQNGDLPKLPDLPKVQLNQWSDLPDVPFTTDKFKGQDFYKLAAWYQGKTGVIENTWVKDWLKDTLGVCQTCCALDAGAWWTNTTARYWNNDKPFQYDLPNNTEFASVLVRTYIAKDTPLGTIQGAFTTQIVAPNMSAAALTDSPAKEFPWSPVPWTGQAYYVMNAVATKDIDNKTKTDMRVTIEAVPRNHGNISCPHPGLEWSDFWNEPQRYGCFAGLPLSDFNGANQTDAAPKQSGNKGQAFDPSNPSYVPSNSTNGLNSGITMIPGNSSNQVGANGTAPNHKPHIHGSSNPVDYPGNANCIIPNTILCPSDR